MPSKGQVGGANCWPWLSYFCNLLVTDFSYQRTEEEEYGAEAFMGLLNDVFGTDLDKDTVLQISASQLAFAELRVSLLRAQHVHP